MMRILKIEIIVVLGDTSCCLKTTLVSLEVSFRYDENSVFFLLSI